MNLTEAELSYACRRFGLCRAQGGLFNVQAQIGQAWFGSDHDSCGGKLCYKMAATLKAVQQFSGPTLMPLNHSTGKVMIQWVGTKVD